MWGSMGNPALYDKEKWAHHAGDQRIALDGGAQGYMVHYQRQSVEV